jgi:hypothetical protein
MTDARCTAISAYHQIRSELAVCLVMFSNNTDNTVVFFDEVSNPGTPKQSEVIEPTAFTNYHLQQMGLRDPARIKFPEQLFMKVHANALSSINEDINAFKRYMRNLVHLVPKSYLRERLKTTWHEYFASKFSLEIHMSF